MRGLFVTGTDTEVGKTIVAAAIVAALVADGLRVAAFKPAVTGLDDPAPDPWPRDHELLAALTGAEPGDRHATHLRPRGLAAPRRRAGRNAAGSRGARRRGARRPARRPTP